MALAASAPSRTHSKTETFILWMKVWLAHIVTSLHVDSKCVIKHSHTLWIKTGITDVYAF